MLQLASQTSFTALTPSDIRTHLNIWDTSMDDYLQRKINAAVLYCERESGMDFRATTWNLLLDSFPIWSNWNFLDRYGAYVYYYPLVGEFAIGRMTQRWQQIQLKRGPLQAVNSITYYDTNNALQTLDSSTYAYVTPAYFPGTVEPLTFWPVAYPRPNAVTVNFTSGFSTVPEQILHAIELLVGVWWSQREDQMTNPNSVSSQVGCAVQRLLDQIKPPVYS